ncbi:MAG: replication-associated recombination protein A [Bacteroidales bacterium]|jgi:putative ATPase|nr:replication-associated recombination protein A [Bacteroidales bacterium]MDI9575264.1 replication-associated recombination protein A [Bacteroidota bacterium]MDD2593966.1 replication-associated recombination protein A [Bacteroidales bacterium]MDD3755394.1 replication-associated recombination protein A [Bacteroidales bacterium]MDY0400402.1 replication-associated recombination protein A [Bacteroidales bacterium]
MSIPLAEQLRPKNWDEFVGQEHLVGADGIIRKLLSSKSLPSLILWGSPGTGKTTIAGLIAKDLQVPFFKLNAIDAGVKDIRNIIQKAQPYKTVILFLDEIHRFSKSQQDSLLHAVEKGIITLIGATTENPSFEIIPPLLSRCQVYVLNPLEISDLDKLLQRAIDFYSSKNIIIEVIEKEALFTYSGGDARKLYNVIELLVDSSNSTNLVISNENVEAIVKQKFLLYDKQGEYHYDLISAFIKSIRNSDPNAAIYWMARMLEGGEDPLFIARRMIILASEDIGLANPNALLLANACFDAVHKIGMPEARIVLAECAIYLASSPKSNASYLSIEKAIEFVHKTGDLPVPLHLRNAPTQFMRSLNYHKGYLYPHDHPNHFIEQECLPDEISGTSFYIPADNSKENELKNYLKKLWKNKYRFE